MPLTRLEYHRMTMRTGYFPISLLLLASACATAADDAAPVSVADLTGDYDSRVGARVRVAGFLVVEGEPFSLYEGTVRPPESRQPLEGGFSATHWCAAVDQVRPLWVTGIGRAELAAIHPLAKRPRHLVAQRVVLEGVLSRRSEGEAIYHPYPGGSDRVGSLTRARIVSVEPVFCAGVSPEP